MIISKPLKIKIAAIGIAKARIVINSKLPGILPPKEILFNIPKAKIVNKVGKINVKFFLNNE